jgi:hypothetical protein
MGRVLGRVGAKESPESPSAAENYSGNAHKIRLIKHK